MAKTLTPHPDLTEAQTIEEWRTEALKQAGYPTEIATLIAIDTNIDLHTACDLPNNGCPIPLAIRILL